MSDVRSVPSCKLCLATHRLAVSGRGFSLVELMVALVIIAILAAVAVPAYRDHLMRSNVPEATSGLLLTAMRLEQYYQDNRSYLNGEACGVSLPPAGRFGFQCTSPADGQSYLLTAAGVRDDLMQDFSYTLDHLGRSQTTGLPTGWAAKLPLDCWVIRRGGTC